MGFQLHYVRSKISKFKLIDTLRKKLLQSYKGSRSLLHPQSSDPLPISVSCAFRGPPSSFTQHPSPHLLCLPLRVLHTELCTIQMQELLLRKYNYGILGIRTQIGKFEAEGELMKTFWTDLYHVRIITL